MPEKNNQLEAYFGLPQEVKWCRQCVVSNQRPSSTIEFKNQNNKTTIDFGNDGVCQACNYISQKGDSIDWQARESMLVELCDRNRSADGSYDVVVPGSGGKDSVYVSHILKHQYGMHPLTVTWPPNIYTEIGRKNFEIWLQGGFPNISNYPDQSAHSRLTREAFINLGHPFQPFFLGQKQVAPKTALQY